MVTIKKRNIAINAQLLPDTGSGGIEMVLIGLIGALGKLIDGPENYTIIGPWEKHDWLRSYIGPNQKIVPGPKPRFKRWLKTFVLDCSGKFKPLLSDLVIRLRLKTIEGKKQEAEASHNLSDYNGFFEKLNASVVHFPFQNFIPTNLPTIFNPHDLQHVHFPEFFSAAAIKMRELTYSQACHSASVVVAGSRWIKEDLMKQLNLPSYKIQVIPWAPPTAVYEEPADDFLDDLRKKLGLQLPFAYYPAPTGRNKNHLRLLDAIALLRSQGLQVRLVCSGFKHEPMWTEIEGKIHRLDLEKLVKFTGHLPGKQLRALYRLAQFVVVPTLFEAASGPMFEAWQEGIAVTSANVTSLPEQAGDAAFLFDPFSVNSIADALQKLTLNENLRQELSRQGIQRLKNFSWERTAKAYRALYRKIAGWDLTEEDKFLLQWDWMKDSFPRQTMEIYG